VYSPKIHEDLIPQLYHVAKSLNMPMTHLVNQLLIDGLARLEEATEHVSEPATPGYRVPARRQGRKTQKKAT